MAESVTSTGLTPPQWAVLALLHDADGRPLTELGRWMTQDSPTMTGIVDRLARAGLVTRRRDQRDRRLLRVYLTASGRALTEGAARGEAAVTEDALAGLSPAEAEHAVTVLRQIGRNLA